VNYLLRSNNNTEWWVVEDYGSSSPFKDVVGPQPKTMIADKKDSK
jgi:hypothetical protein